MSAVAVVELQPQPRLVELQPHIGERRGQLPQGPASALGDGDRVTGDPRQLDQAERARGPPRWSPATGARHGSGVSLVGGIGQLGDYVVVVGVEPLGHLPGLVVGRAPRQVRHRDEGVIVLRPTRGPPPASPPSPASGRRGRSRRWRCRRVAAALRGGRGSKLLDPGLELLGAGLARPAAFQGPLELAVRPDPGVTEEVGGHGHGASPIRR